MELIAALVVCVLLFTPIVIMLVNLRKEYNRIEADIDRMAAKTRMRKEWNDKAEADLARYRASSKEEQLRWKWNISWRFPNLPWKDDNLEKDGGAAKEEVPLSDIELLTDAVKTLDAQRGEILAMLRDYPVVFTCMGKRFLFMYEHEVDALKQKFLREIEEKRVA